MTGPRRASGATEQHGRAAPSIPRSRPCPDTPVCRQHWHALSDAAECALCWHADHVTWLELVHGLSTAIRDV
jgi:hypothetical protein